MKKFLKFTLLVTAFINVLAAETIFDLHAQHFSNSLDGDGVGARYNLEKVYVSTALKYVDGLYAPTNTSTQTMAVEIKTPPSNWSVSFDVSYALYSGNHPIRLTSDTGKTIHVSFGWNEIYLNGSVIYSRSDRLEFRTAVSGTISKSGNTVTCSINGYVVEEIIVNNFSKLKFVNVSLLYDSRYDYLNGLNIGSH